MKKSIELAKKLEQVKASKKALVAKCIAEYGDSNWDEYYTKFGGMELCREEDRLEEQIRVEQRREIEVGDGCTVHLYSDAEAYTVIKKTPCTITIQRDRAILDENFKPEWIEGGFAGHCINQDKQSYTYEKNPNGHKITARWSEKYGAYRYADKSITLGRHEFYDYNF